MSGSTMYVLVITPPLIDERKIWQRENVLPWVFMVQLIKTLHKIPLKSQMNDFSEVFGISNLNLLLWNQNISLIVWFIRNFQFASHKTEILNTLSNVWAFLYLSVIKTQKDGYSCTTIPWDSICESNKNKRLRKNYTVKTYTEGQNAAIFHSAFFPQNLDVIVVVVFTIGHYRLYPYTLCMM